MVIYKNGWNVNKWQQRFMFITCNITGLTSYYAYKLNLPYYVTYPIYAVWISANLYWHNPLDNWRRKLDIFTMTTSCLYSIFCGYIYKPPYWYLTSLGICGTAGIFRVISMYYYNLLEKLHDKTNSNDEEGIYYCPTKCNYSWKSTLAHSGIHIFTNLFVALTAYTYSNLS